MKCALPFPSARPAVDADHFCARSAPGQRGLRGEDYSTSPRRTAARRPACCASSPLRAARTRTIRASTCCSRSGRPASLQSSRSGRTRRPTTRIWPPPTRKVREKVNLLIGAIDDQVHNGMEIAGAGAAGPARGAIFVVTHVDVPPPKDECVAALKTLVADSRKEPGSVRYGHLPARQPANHFSVVGNLEEPEPPMTPTSPRRTQEIPRSAHPMSGALYDERLYRRSDAFLPWEATRFALPQ